VPVKRLDEIIDDPEIDVEGANTRVLMGAERLFATSASNKFCRNRTSRGFNRSEFKKMKPSYFFGPSVIVPNL
jgi:hypothetical protein